MSFTEGVNPNSRTAKLLRGEVKETDRTDASGRPVTSTPSTATAPTARKVNKCAQAAFILAIIVCFAYLASMMFIKNPPLLAKFGCVLVPALPISIAPYVRG